MWNLILLDYPMFSVPFIPLFRTFVSLPNLFDAKRSHTSLVIRYSMRCLYYIMLPVLGSSTALVYFLVAVYDKGYTLLWLGISIVLTSSLTKIACTASVMNCVGYMCVLGCLF